MDQKLSLEILNLTAMDNLVEKQLAVYCCINSKRLSLGRETVLLGAFALLFYFFMFLLLQ